MICLDAEVCGPGMRSDELGLVLDNSKEQDQGTGSIPVRFVTT